MRDIAEIYNAHKSKDFVKKPKPRLGASSVLGCQRKLALRLTGHTPPPSKGASHLSEGQMHEKEIIETLIKIGVDVRETGEKDGWFDMVIGGVPVKGQRDGILPEFPAVLEVKSIAHESKLRPMMKPYTSWKVQSEVYMRSADLPMTILFAKARDTGWARQFVFTRSNRLWKKIEENVSTVRWIKDPWSHKVPWGKECQWCEWRKKCWPDRFPEIEFDAF